MHVLLLGSSGLLGHNVLLRLLQQGHSVVAVVRRRDALQLPASVLDDPRLTVVVASILDVEQLRMAAQGCDSIINCAGTTDMSLLNYDDYLPVNKTACEYTLQLMDELDIGTLVYVSTANTIGYGDADSPAGEDEPMRPPFTKSYYALSKREAERMLLWSAQQNPERHIVIVNPGFMIGAYDVKPSSGKLMDAAYRRRFMVAPGGGKCFVAVSDVAIATVNALTMGRNGERYLLTGTSMSVADFYRLQQRLCGYKQKLFVLSDALVRLAGRVGDLLRWMRLRTPLSTRNVRQLLVNEYYDNSKARNELDMPQTSIEKALKDYFSWRKE